MTSASKLRDSEITEEIIGSFYEVYNELGYGFLESVYREAMVVALRSRGLEVETEKVVKVYFRGTPIGIFRTDLVVSGRVIVTI